MFLAPCTLPMVPGYLAFIGDASLVSSSNNSRWRIFFNGLSYVFGFTLIFVLLGILAGFLGANLGISQSLLSKLGGLFVIFFGLMTTGLINFDFWRKKGITPPVAIKRGHPLGSFFLGASFATGWTPCVGPILGTVLFLASSTQTMFEGAWYLFVFSLGMALPFLLIAAFMGAGASLVKKMTPFLRFISVSGGVVMIFLGILLFLNKMNLLIAWGYRILPDNYSNIVELL